ncbi:Flagellar hook-basal body complex protein FliE [Gammaproteobacteria bacterium]
MNTTDINGLLVQMRAAATLAQGRAPTPAAPPIPEVAPPNFSSLLRQSIDAVNQLQQNSAKLSADFERGAVGVDLPEVMVAGQKANISFQAMTQVRNKLVSAYQEIMSMQV